MSQIYPQDAALIVALLNLTLPVPGEDPVADAGPPVEIFEAGTGMGSLTLHLAHAIHGANPPVPPFLREALCCAHYAKRSRARDGKEASSEADEPADASAQERADSTTNGQMDVATSETAEDETTDPHPLEWEDPQRRDEHARYLASRRAIVHTLDVNGTSSRNAHKLLRKFRRAQYLLDVSFHVSTIERYLGQRLAAHNDEPFLSHAILDLPDTELHGDIIQRALRPDGTLVIFCPSITQVADFVKHKPPALMLERVLELPTSTTQLDGPRQGASGVEWDVRMVTPRKDLPRTPDAVPLAPRQVAVCRKKVGISVTGGGFVAVFRRMPERKREETPEKLPDALTLGIDDTLSTGLQEAL